MAYKPTAWVDGETPVNAENLNKIEGHIDEIVKLAASCNLSTDEIIEMVRFSLEESK